MKIDRDSKETNGSKSLKELKEYLRSEFEKKTETWERRRGATYLHFAAYLGDVDATKMLIEDSAEVGAVDDKKWTALHWAAEKGHADVARVLIENGADVNAVDKWKQSALHRAANGGHVEIVKVLIQNGADVNAVDWIESTALHWAAKYGHVDVVKVLIQNGADVNAVRKDKWTALHWAAKYGHVDVVKVLIQNGADVNAVDEDKWTALRLAARYGHVRCTLLLLCFGAEIDEQAIKEDKTELLRPIESRLKLLRDGNRMGTSLMSDEERRFLWNLGVVLAVKYPAIAFGTHRRIRSFVTFHGIFMEVGYCLGKGSVWMR